VSGGERPPTPLQVGLSGRCPRCGASGLFTGIVTFAPKCRACGLDFAAMNVGDGPAPFLIFGIGAIVVGLALWLEFTVFPPWWVHALIWPPVVFGMTLGALRVAKGIMIAIEWREGAREGRGG